MKRKKNRVEKLKVMIGGKLTEIDFEDKFFNDSCSEKKYYRSEELKIEGKWSRAKLFKFIERVKGSACDFHEKLSYDLVRDAFFLALDYLLYSDRELISPLETHLHKELAFK